MKEWRMATVSVQLGLPNEERERDRPWAEVTSGARFAAFLNLNGIGVAESQLLNRRLNNGSMHHYVLLFVEQGAVKHMMKVPTGTEIWFD